MKRIFVSGAITPTSPGNHAIEFLANVREGIRLSIELLCAGYAVYCPFTDFHYWLQLPVGKCLSVEMIYKADLAMLEVCDALLLVPGWEQSVGVRGEVQRAKELHIPIFTTLEELTMVIDA